MRYVLVFIALLTAAPAGAVEVAHRWGRTAVEGVPARIVSLSYTGADAMLALGIVPVAYRAWYGGDAETGLWPWAELPKGAAPVVLRGEIDLEAVARLEPDLIEAMFSGIGRAEYAALSRIAPVLAPPEGAGDFGATWQEMLVAIGRATGREDRAGGVIAQVWARAGALRAAHPAFDGASVAVAWPAGPLVYGPDDPRLKALSMLGLVPLRPSAGPTRGAFFTRLDPELTVPLEADALIWLDVGGGVAAIHDQPLRTTMRAVAEGREVVADPQVAAALSYGSALSLPFALDRLAPLLDAALDGDPATPVPGTGGLR